MTLWLYLLLFWLTQVLANVALKLGSAVPNRRRRWIAGFLIGNAIGTFSVFIFTLICRQLPDNPNRAALLAGGGAFVACQVALAYLFASRLRPRQWLGIGLIAVGMALTLG